MSKFIESYLNDEVGSRKLKVKAEFDGVGRLLVSIEGYGDEGRPVIIDLFNDKLQVVVWADINNEDPTHVIDLKGALESERRQ